MKPGAGQGSPLRVAPSSVQSDTGQNYYMPGVGRLRLDGRFTDFAFKMLVLGSRSLGAHAIPRGHERREPAGRGTSSTRGWRGSGNVGLRLQDDMELALAVRRRWCGGGRGGAGYVWTVYEMACFLFHVATSSAVLLRVSLTSGWCLSFSSSTEFFLVVNRDRYPQLRFLSLGLWCCSTLTRWSMYLGRGCSMEACERISHIFYVLLALFAWNLVLISLSPLFWQPPALVRCDSPRKLLDEFRLFST